MNPDSNGRDPNTGNNNNNNILLDRSRDADHFLHRILALPQFSLGSKDVFIPRHRVAAANLRTVFLSPRRDGLAPLWQSVDQPTRGSSAPLEFVLAAGILAAWHRLAR